MISFTRCARVRNVRALAAVLACAAMVPSGPAQAQATAPLQQVINHVNIDSGIVRNTLGKRDVAYTTQISVKNATWLCLLFESADLGAAPHGGTPTILKITSALDGGVQIMNAVNLKQWQDSSAYFNGDTITLQIIADPDAATSHIVIKEVVSGIQDDGGIATLCGADNRVLSTDPRVARIVPVGCTAWLISDANHEFLTAGHCAGSGLATIEFNVPPSSGSGSLMHPGPQDQYAVDPASVQFHNGGLGNDWTYFGCFPNSNTGLTAYQAQGDFYILAPSAPPVNGQLMRITGYGTDTTPPQNNQVQQTSDGPYFSSSGTVIEYQTDTMPGNSGSPVQDESTNMSIGIHTNGGCTGSGGSNSGTAIQNAGLQNALANPQGVCIPAPNLMFTYPNGLPANINPSGASIQVVVSGANGDTPQPGTGTLYYNIGAGYIALNMAMGSPNVYTANFPAIPCGTIVKFYFSAADTTNTIVNDPFSAPAITYSAISALGTNLLLYDNIEGSTITWSKVNDPSLTGGAWVQVDPNGTTNGSIQAAPENDNTPAPGTRCFVTENGTVGGPPNAADVDGGPAHLLSPAVNLSGTDALISYAQWFYSSGTGDTLTVSVSNDNGASWTPVATVTGTNNGSNTAWQTASFRVSDFVTPSAQVRVRFSAVDNPPDNIVEAGIDDFRVTQLTCPAACPADINHSGAVNVDDLLAVINGWGPCPAPPTSCPADIAPAGPPQGNGQVNVDDLLAVINGWGPCP